MDILYESSKNTENNCGVFVLGLTSGQQPPIIEHVDRICKVLGIHVADRRRFRTDYLQFVKKQPKGSYIKFSVKLATETNPVVVSPESPSLHRSHKLLYFDEVETWTSCAESQPCSQIIDHFNLKNLSTVSVVTTGRTP